MAVAGVAMTPAAVTTDSVAYRGVRIHVDKALLQLPQEDQTPDPDTVQPDDRQAGESSHHTTHNTTPRHTTYNPTPNHTIRQGGGSGSVRPVR